VHIRRRRWLIVAALLSALVVAAAISVAIRIPFSSKVLRDRLVSALEDRLDADVDLQELTLRVYPRVHASGRGLTIRFEQRTDVPPLIAIQEFNVDADLIGLWRHRVARVRLDGLAINIPPDDPDSEPDTKDEPDKSGTPPDASVYGRDVVIEELDAPDAQLTILRSEPQKAALKRPRFRRFAWAKRSCMDTQRMDGEKRPPSPRATTRQGVDATALPPQSKIASGRQQLLEK